MQRAIAALSPHDAAEFPRFLAENRVKMDRFRPILESPFLGWHDLITPHLARLLPTLRPFHSLDGELRRYFRDPRVRLAMTFQSKYLGMSPFQCPSLFSILSFLEYEYGVFHPIGGCSAVTESMAEVARELGVTISLEDEVQEIAFRGRRAVGVRSTSGLHECDALVINADFARAMARLVPDALRRRWSDRKIAGKRFSCSTFMLYLGVEGRFDELAHHTIYLAEDYLRNLDEIENRHVLSEDPSFYVQNACVTDPEPGARGCSTLYVLVPVTHQHANVDWYARGPAIPSAGPPPARQVGDRGRRDADPVRADGHAGGLGPAARDPPRRDLQPGAYAPADAPPPAAQPLRGPGIRLPGRRGDPPGQRPAGHLRIGPDHVASDRPGVRDHRPDRRRGPVRSRPGSGAIENSSSVG